MTKERRWESLFLTPEEHEELWTEIIFELRGGVFPSLASKKSADKFFWKHVKKRLDAFSPRACKFPAKVLHADLEDERALERSLARDLNVGKPLFQALESMDPVLFWDWKISNGLVLNIVRHVIEPDLEKPSSSANRSVKTLVAVGKETYAVPNVEGIDRCIAEYPALYLKWMTLMKTILEDVIPKMMLDKRITALDLAATDINVFDMHFTLEQTEDDLRKLDTFMSKCDVLLPWDEFRRNVGRKRETYHWNPSALAFKVLKQHGGTIRKVEDKENTARIVKEAPSTAIIPRVALRDLKPRPSTEALSSRRLEDYRIPQRPVVAAASSAVLNPSVRRSAVVRSVSIAGLAKHHAEPPFKRPAKTLKKNVTPKQGCVELNITDIRRRFSGKGGAQGAAQGGAQGAAQGGAQGRAQGRAEALRNRSCQEAGEAEDSTGS
ncbi:hypothetical protein L596_013052 [Steinernema carpocapsae]|uniref:Uncharacterized protein n=1 Tax=Steinernema carpocapsae TaxID=34508 RepID=A0A4U5NYY0_STECR|nr:hypothetical protein L596_013052 [Steinernema carpocapsae]